MLSGSKVLYIRRPAGNAFQFQGMPRLSNPAAPKTMPEMAIQPTLLSINLLPQRPRHNTGIPYDFGYLSQILSGEEGSLLEKKEKVFAEDPTLLPAIATLRPDSVGIGQFELLFSQVGVFFSR